MSQQDIFLEFDNPMSQFFAGLQWDASPEAKSGLRLFAHHDDLDISCALLDKNKNVLGVITPVSPQTAKYRFQILHTGDNRTGKSDLEDEEIHINLKMVDPDIYHIFFLVSNKKGSGFDGVRAPFCHFMDSSTFRKFLSVDLRQHKVPDELANNLSYFSVAMLNRIPTNKLDGDDWSLAPILKYIVGHPDGPDEREIALIANVM